MTLTPARSSRYTLIESDDERDLFDFADEVRAGLTAVPKTLPCRFLYDTQGSHLFEKICELPEYYLTRAEHEILADRADEIAALFAEPATLVELGSGSSTKTRELISAMLRRQGDLRYVPVDISRSMLDDSSQELLESYDALEVRAFACEYTEGLRLLHQQVDGPLLVAFLGSNVGNYERDDAAAFLTAVRGTLDPADRMLVGIDLRKDAATLESAYDDARGVTARFSLNLLERINAELGGKFDLRSFAHRATWEPEPGRVKIDVVSLREQEVGIAYLDMVVPFADGEAIHTESSYKYSTEEIGALAADAGLRVEQRWLDAAQRFSLNLFAPV